MIQWLVYKSSDFLCFWTNLRFWMNRVSQWFSDSFRNPVTSFVSEQIYVFEWIEWVSDSVTRSEIQWLPLFLNKSTFLNESSESVIQWLVYKSSDFLCFWTNLHFWTSRAIQWFSESFINAVTSFLNKSVFEWIGLISDSRTHSLRESLASVLNKSAIWTNWVSQWFNDSFIKRVTGLWISCLNELSEAMFQWLIHDCNHLLSFWTNLHFWTDWVSWWFSDSFIKMVTCFVSE